MSLPHLVSLETPAVIFGFINIVLAARGHILNWPFGMMMVSLYFILYFRAKLYADMALQLVFFVLQGYGWYQWLYGGKDSKPLTVRATPKQIFLPLAIVSFILFGMISWILITYTDSTTPYQDAFITALSLIAQFMISKKWLENWWVWIAVDIVSIQLYLVKNLFATAGLYSVFLVCCVYGYFQWRKLIANKDVCL